jgi:solute:Na+ symporter, SSS family
MRTALTLTSIDWVICIFALGGSIVLGVYLALRSRAGESSSNFFLAGRRLTWPIIGASLFGSNIGAEHLVGLSGDAYRYGLSAGNKILRLT